MNEVLTEENIKDLKVLIDLIEEMEHAPYKIDTQPFIRQWFRTDFELIRSIVKYKSKWLEV